MAANLLMICITLLVITILVKVSVVLVGSYMLITNKMTADQAGRQASLITMTAEIASYVFAVTAALIYAFY